MRDATDSPTFRLIEVDVEMVTTLAWKGDDLFDMASGDVTIELDPVAEKRRSVRFSSYGLKFDRAVACQEGCHQGIYQARGTKALVRNPADQLEELNRSYYHAEVYEYPICIFHSASRSLVAHCPHDYNVIELHDSDTWESLTPARGRKAHDFFHSRLSVSPGARYLLSAGWFWHPFESIMVFDVGEALSDHTHLDGPGLQVPVAAEVDSATFLGPDRVLIATKGDERLDDPDHDSRALGAAQLGCWSISEGDWVTRARLNSMAGTLVAVGPGHVLGLYGHPKLIDVESGAIVQEWPGIRTGRQDGSLLLGEEADRIPPIARDESRARLAVAGDGMISLLLAG
jgi:hypothetical protein